MIKKEWRKFTAKPMHMYMYRQVAPKFCNCLLIIAFMFLFRCLRNVVMPGYFATQALLAEGWAHNVRLDVDAAGMLPAITPDSTAQDAVRLSGPVIRVCRIYTMHSSG